MKKIIIFILFFAIFNQAAFSANSIFFSTKGKYVEARAIQQVNPDFIKQVDYLYELVCKSLGIKKEPIGLILVIYKTDKEIDDLYGQILPHKAFFKADENAIYASLESMTDGMMAHEIAHALIFKELDGKGTINMHEILAKYAEYYIAKISKKEEN